jgi:hypothetical protein
MIFTIVFDKIFISKLLGLYESEKNKHFLKEVLILVFFCFWICFFPDSTMEKSRLFFYPDYIFMTHFDLQALNQDLLVLVSN